MAYERLFSRTSGEALSVHCRHCSDLYNFLASYCLSLTLSYVPDA